MVRRRVSAVSNHEAPPSPVAILRDAASRLLRMSGCASGLSFTQPLVELRDVDQPAGVVAFAELARALERVNLEADDAAFHHDDLGRGPHRGSDHRGGEM